MNPDPATRLSSVLSGEITSTGVPGLGERPVAAPSSEEECSDVVRLAVEEGWALFVTGFGSKLGWSRPPERADLVLSTRNLDGVTSYEPGDGTLSARAGTSMAELAATVSAGGHHLTPDVPYPERASLGGVIAAGESGVDRLACGPIRHNLLGTRVCLADGSRTRSGGQLVKNVTGYDLHRLYCGSHGTLGVVLEASLRLYPRPESSAALTRRFTSWEEALALSTRLLELPVRPRAVTIDADASTWRLVVSLAGRGDVVDWERRCVEEVVEGVERVEGPAAEELLREVRDLERPQDERPSLWIGCKPSRLASILRRLQRTTAEPSTRMLVQPGVASVTLVFEELSRFALEEVERDLHKSGADARWRGLDLEAASPGDLSQASGGMSEASGSLPLMRRLKQALDPEGVFAPGRLHGI